MRLAFEKVTGRDLNWFFNEWYYNKGFPVLNINHSYDAGSHQETVTIDQTQDLTSNPVFYMPLQIDIYVNGKKESHQVLMDKSKNKYVFDVSTAPDLVVADGKKMMVVCTKYETMSIAEREYQYEYLPLYTDRVEALSDLSSHMDDPSVRVTFMKAAHDRFWGIRRTAIRKLAGDSNAEFKNLLLDLAAHDSSSVVRAEAISLLSSGYKEGKLMQVYRNALKDSSYKVESEGLSAIGKINKQEALNDARKLENGDGLELLFGIAAFYVENGNDSCNNFFVKLADKLGGYEQKIPYLLMYGRFIQQSSDTAVLRGITVIGNMKNDENRYVKFYAKSALQNILSIYQDRDSDLTSKISDLKTKNASGSELSNLQSRLDSTTNIEKVINSYLGE